MDGFVFPLGVYPVQEMSPVPGYTLTFESADGTPYDDDDTDGPDGDEALDDAEDEDDEPDDPLGGTLDRPHGSSIGGPGPRGGGGGDSGGGGSGISGGGGGGGGDSGGGKSDVGGSSRPSRGLGGGPRKGPSRGLGPGMESDELRGGGDRGFGPGPRDGPRDDSDGDGSSGDPNEDWTQWPDRYVFDINISAARVEALCRALFALLPGRVYPILDVMGNDAFREIDPYIAYDLVGMERFYDGVRRFRPWLYEDGLVGFGAMSEDPFFYVFVDEHKIVTVRAEAHMKEQIEQLLAAFDLREVDKIAGADEARHEHRSVLDQDALTDRPDLLAHDEIVEELRDLWGLTLNVDPVRNPDDDGHELGMTYWRCIVRVLADEGNMRYAEALLSAENLQTAGDLACSAVEQLDPALSPETPPDDQEPSELDVLVADRLRETQVRDLLGEQAKMGLDLTANQIIAARWLE